MWIYLRILDRAGFGGEVTCLFMYGLSLLFFMALRPRAIKETFSSLPALMPIALLAGWSNIGFLLGVIHAEVMRVTMLFYTSPVWAALFSWIFLKERLTRAGAGIMAVAILGMLMVLWRPESGLPVPQSGAEWLGLSAGVCFALSNVLSRRAASCSVDAKSMSVCMGMIAVSAATLLARPQDQVFPGWPTLLHVAPLLVGLSLLAVTTSLAVQFGMKHTPANRAMVIFLFEIVVAAASSWLIAHEAMGVRELLGGLLIIASSTLASRQRTRPGQPEGAAGA